MDGVHRDLDDSSDEENETQKLLSDVRDLNYVRHKHSVELKVRRIDVDLDPRGDALFYSEDR